MAGRAAAEQPDQQYGGRDADQQVVDRVVEAVEVVGHGAEGVGEGAVGERVGAAEHRRAVQEGHRVREHPEGDGADVPPPPAGGEPPGRQPERQDVEQRPADRVAHRAHHGGRADEPGVGDLHPDGRGGRARQHRRQCVDEHHPTEWISRAVGVQQHARGGGGQRVDQDRELVPGGLDPGRVEVDQHVADPERGDRQAEHGERRGPGEPEPGGRPARRGPGGRTRQGRERGHRGHGTA